MPAITTATADRIVANLTEWLASNANVLGRYDAVSVYFGYDDQGCVWGVFGLDYPSEEESLRPYASELGGCEGAEFEFVEDGDDDGDLPGDTDTVSGYVAQAFAALNPAQWNIWFDGYDDQGCPSYRARRDG